MLQIQLHHRAPAGRWIRLRELRGHDEAVLEPGTLTIPSLIVDYTWGREHSFSMPGEVIHVEDEPPEIFEALEMHDTGFHVPQDKANRFVNCYTPKTSG